MTQPVIRTFVDSGVLLAVTRGLEPAAQRAEMVLGDIQRVFLSSDFVRLELLPKARFHRQSTEVMFYERFFESVSSWAEVSPNLIDHALEIGATWNLNAIDALHVAAAIELDADEIVTSERPASPLLRVRIDALTVVSIQ